MTLAVLLLQVGLLIAFVVAPFLLRKIVGEYVSEKAKNLATKQDVAAITREIEHVRAAFREHDKRFGIYYEKQFNVIGGVYERLEEASRLVGRMVHPVQAGGDVEESARRDSALKAFNELAGFYWKNRIYMPEEICSEIEPVLELMKTAVTGYLVGRRKGSEGGSTDRWYDAWVTMRDKVPELQRDLDRRVRELIAVPSVGRSEPVVRFDE